MAQSTDVRSFENVFIGGEWQEPAADDRTVVISPSTEEPVASVPSGSAADIDRAVAAARTAFDSGVWSGMPKEQRAEYMIRIADEIDKRRPEMVTTFCHEVGAPLAVSESLHAVASTLWRFNAKWLLDLPLEEHRRWENDGSGVLLHEPLGVVGAITVWNGPVPSFSIKAAPALAAGNTVVAKPAADGPVTNYLLAEAIEAAGLPPGVVSIVPGGREVGEHLVTHPGVDQVTLTGSTAAGRRVMQLCADRMTRVSLELGGKSAGIVLDDAPLDQAVPHLAAAVSHSGQVCSAITRVLAPRSRYAEVVEALGAALAALNVGDPFDPATDLGPLVAERQRDRVEQYLAMGRDAGARVVVGGGRPAGLDRGWYVEPTLFADVDNGMRIAREEIFGPVLVAIPYDTVDEAVAIANDSDYGLSGAVFAGDHERALAVGRRIRSGQVFLNAAGGTAFQPFGGFKQSGIGREGGPDGILVFTEPKLLTSSASHRHE